MSYLHQTRASDCSGKPAARFFSGRGFGAKSTVPQQDCETKENCDAACPPNFNAHNENIFIPIEKKIFITTTPEFLKYLNLSL
jgi:hypothetical protein